MWLWRSVVGNFAVGLYEHIENTYKFGTVYLTKARVESRHFPSMDLSGDGNVAVAVHTRIRKAFSSNLGRDTYLN